MVESFIFLTDLCFLKGTNSAKEKKNQIIMTWLVYNKLLCMHVCVCVCVCVCGCARMHRHSTYHYQYVEKCTIHNTRKYTDD